MIALLKNTKFHSQTKHIDIKYHFLQQEVDAQCVSFTYISTTQQATDSLIKSLLKIAFQQFVNIISIK